MSVVNDIEIIVSEIDGVITNGCDSIDYMNHTMFKTFCMRDFEAITELQAHFTFVFLSSDVAVSYNVMRQRNIPAYFATSREDKLTILTKKILPRYNTRPDNLFYIGSLKSDLPCMKLASMSASPAPSTTYCDNSLLMDVGAGAGALCWVAGFLRDEMARRNRR